MTTAAEQDMAEQRAELDAMWCVIRSVGVAACGASGADLLAQLADRLAADMGCGPPIEAETEIARRCWAISYSLQIDRLNEIADQVRALNSFASAKASVGAADISEADATSPEHVARLLITTRVSLDVLARGLALALGPDQAGALRSAADILTEAGQSEPPSAWHHEIAQGYAEATQRLRDAADLLAPSTGQMAH